jgi:hypothetical protein
MTINKEMAPVLSYADVEQVLNKHTHLSSRQDWMKQVEQTASGFIKGVANGIVAGAGPKATTGEEGAYAVGDILGAVGINSAALLTGVFAPAVWAGYGLAREANREVDAGKPLNPVAIAASGAISAIPGTAAVKVPLGTLGRIGTGVATGYTSDIANRGVQQLGDTGHINPKTLDYRPGLGTVTGGTVGLLSHPTVSQAFQKYLLGRQAQILAGEKVPVSLEDFLQKAQKENGWTDEALAFYMGRSSTPPVESPYARQNLWSPGKRGQIQNAFRHADDHAHEFELPQSDPHYIQLAHDFDQNVPAGTELKIMPWGQQVYYHEATNTILFKSPQGAIQSLYRPVKGRAWFDGQPGEYYGRIK